MNVNIVSRREGDPESLVADNRLIKKELDWQPKYNSLDNIVKHALEWETKIV